MATKQTATQMTTQNDEPVPCPDCDGPMSADRGYPVCVSCRAQAEADRPRNDE